MSETGHTPSTPDDRAFDLLKAVADYADSHGLRRTSKLIEAAMDAWLLETRGIGLVRLRAEHRSPGQFGRRGRVSR